MEQEGNAIIKNRDFACACGKKYFSYAALFTHIKQKHDGKVSIIIYIGARPYCST